MDRNSRAYRNALFHLLASQTSCFRYWGQGVWTDYGQEICRRGMDILAHDFRYESKNLHAQTAQRTTGNAMPSSFSVCLCVSA